MFYHLEKDNSRPDLDLVKLVANEKVPEYNKLQFAGLREFISQKIPFRSASDISDIVLLCTKHLSLNTPVSMKFHIVMDSVFEDGTKHQYYREKIVDFVPFSDKSALLCHDYKYEIIYYDSIYTLCNRIHQLYDILKKLIDLPFEEPEYLKKYYPIGRCPLCNDYNILKKKGNQFVCNDCITGTKLKKFHVTLPFSDGFCQGF